MALPGWYPDPGGARGRYRYWDGEVWSAGTTANPADPPPAGGAARPPRRRRGPLIAVLAVLLVAALAVAGAWLLRSDGSRGAAPEPTATSSAPAGPIPTSEAPEPSPSPTTSGFPTPTRGPAGACPVGDPGARQPHPADNRVHGGGLSFARQPGWRPSALKSHLTWAYDVDGEERAVEPEWYALLAVGALSTVDGFETSEQAAAAVMECTANPRFYAGLRDRRDLAFEPVTVQGRPGWRIRSEILVDNERTDLPGDLVEVVVVDTGQPESLAMFWGAVPLGDEALAAQLDRVVAGLRVE